MATEHSYPALSSGGAQCGAVLSFMTRSKGSVCGFVFRYFDTKKVVFCVYEFLTKIITIPICIACIVTTICKKLWAFGMLNLMSVC